MAHALAATRKYKDKFFISQRKRLQKYVYVVLIRD